MHAMKQLRISPILAGFIAALFLGSSAVAQTSPDRLALKGYDPVAYFTEQRPMVGNAQYQHEWDGAIYRFASAKHLELFKAEPIAICRSTTIGALRRWRKAKRCTAIPNVGSWSTVACICSESRSVPD